MMDIGILDQMQDFAGRDDRECIAQAELDIQLADRLGFESFWFGEHHLGHHLRSNSFGRIPVPELLVARFATMTERIRIGSGVKVLSLDTALHFAEEMSLLDILTDGRAVWGIGSGSKQVGRYLQVTDDDKYAGFRDQLTDLTAILRNEATEERPLVTPLLRADLTNTLWVAARDEPTILLAARLGLNLTSGQAENPYRQARYAGWYRNAGGSGETRTCRIVYVGSTNEEALEKVRETAVAQFKHARNSPYYRDAVADGTIVDTDPEDLTEVLYRINHVVGGPKEVAAQLKRHLEIVGSDRLDVQFHIPGVTGEDVRDSMRRFVDEVAPELESVGRRMETRPRYAPMVAS